MTIAPIEGEGIRLATGCVARSNVLSIERARAGEERGKSSRAGLSNSRPRRDQARTAWNALRTVGAEGPAAFLIGLVWLLYTFNFSIPWYSIFPLALLVGGGAFIVAHITYQLESDIPEALRDRCDH